MGVMILGHLNKSIGPPAAMLAGLCVSGARALPAGGHRGRGHANALLLEAEPLARDSGCNRIMIARANHTATAPVTCAAAGYTRTGTGLQKRQPPDRALS